MRAAVEGSPHAAFKASSAAMTARPRPAWRSAGAAFARPKPTQPTPVPAYQVTSSSVDVDGLTAQASSWFTHRKAKIPAAAAAALLRRRIAAATKHAATTNAAADAAVKN